MTPFLSSWIVWREYQKLGEVLSLMFKNYDNFKGRFLSLTLLIRNLGKNLSFICPYIHYYLEDVTTHDAICCGSEIQNKELLFITFQC